jgi:hypothetical protein
MYWGIIGFSIYTLPFFRSDGTLRILPGREVLFINLGSWIYSNLSRIVGSRIDPINSTHSLD